MTEHVASWGEVWKEVDPAVESGRADHFGITDKAYDEPTEGLLIMLGWDEFDRFERVRLTEFTDGIWMKLVTA